MAKTQLFDPKLQEAAQIFKALAHPARLEILNYIAQSQVCISGDISNELPLSRTTVHQHLAELKNLDLIKGEISGVRTCYCLNNDKIRKVKGLLFDFLAKLDCSIC